MVSLSNHQPRQRASFDKLRMSGKGLRGDFAIVLPPAIALTVFRPLCVVRVAPKGMQLLARHNPYVEVGAGGGVVNQTGE